MRYLQIKKATPEERKKFVKHTAIFAGKAAPGYYIAKLVIRLIVNVSKIVVSFKRGSEWQSLTCRTMTLTSATFSVLCSSPTTGERNPLIHSADLQRLCR